MGYKVVKLPRGRISRIPPVQYLQAAWINASYLTPEYIKKRSHPITQERRDLIGQFVQKHRRLKQAFGMVQNPQRIPQGLRFQIEDRLRVLPVYAQELGVDPFVFVLPDGVNLDT